ncbi:hypothetical protein [Pedobacter sp. UC225_65]|uniref:hypothetical protein n=1 Tax=Pedobacter sp. UC225_65 TaxID=3350173 RepID=UPI00366EBD9A
MKKLVLLFCICAFISCKKDAAKDITKYRWVLDKAVVSPAMTVGNRTTTDYKSINGPHSCLANNYTYVFLTTGTYQVSSNGALCDMVANSSSQKWTKEGDKIILANGYGSNREATVEGNKMEQTSTFSKEGITYTVKYTYKAKSK